MEKLLRLNVVIGVILLDNTVLITRRGKQQSFAGCWEFPGGKVDTCEKPSDALTRELYEELGVTLARFKHWFNFSHTYPEYQVNFFCYIVTDFAGKPQCLAGQSALKTVSLDELKQLSFPEANQVIIQRLLDEHSTLVEMLS